METPRARRPQHCRGIDPIEGTEIATTGSRHALNRNCRGIDPIEGTEIPVAFA